MSGFRFNGRFAAALGCAALLASAAHAEQFNIPAGDLKVALDAYARQSGIAVLFSSETIRGIQTRGVKGELSATTALTRILSGTGLATYQDRDGSVGISKQNSANEVSVPTYRVAAAAAASVETVVVTSSKIKGDIQTVPIAITALSQEQLTSRQIAGGPDLVKEVPNLTFSKTNFTGYNIQIRGIGTQAISVTTDPAVAVALNDIPFIRNHFFEQEFYDVSQVEVLRGPQGTLYGRNATAGVVNVISAKPTDQFEMMLSADGGNYNNRRFEGMINIPIVDDRVDLRIAGEWTKRDGYSFNSITSQPIDGRDLWSGRVSLSFRPFDGLQANIVWEHFQENDDRLRSSKQLCKTDPTPTEIGGFPIPGLAQTGGQTNALTGGPGFFSQGCRPASLYSPDSFEVPNGDSFSYVAALRSVGPRFADIDPYESTLQSRNLRVIESTINPIYKAKNDIIELNVDYNLTPDLTLTSQTGFNHDFLYSAEDYNRFNTAPGVLLNNGPDDTIVTAPLLHTIGGPGGVFCDPQLGCTNRLVSEDLSEEHAWQLSQEFRVTSNFEGPLNFSIGGNYLHYETEENYYVFINALTLFAAGAGGYSQTDPWTAGVSDNHQCMKNGFQDPDPNHQHDPVFSCKYIDPNPIGSLNNNGHNYFLSQNPYVLNSYAGFGEVYYNLTSDLKLTGGLRWTDDEKRFIEIPSEVLLAGWGYPVTGILNQKWNQWTGRFATNWTPKLDFTDQTLVYASFAHGYKAGGANPPGAVLLLYNGGDIATPIHPLTFKPEFIDAYELGTKNTLLDGALTLNGDVFYYDYKAYQISEIVDRTSINLNFDTTVKGAELETTWEAAPGLKFSFAGGYEDARMAKGSKAVDLMDRTAGHTDWVVMKPDVTQASNCIVRVSDVVNSTNGGCGAYNSPNPPAAPNNGAGFDKDLSGNQLPNAPNFTTSLTAEYTIPVSDNWAATLHSDFYWQSQSFARVFNDRPYDKIRGYSNVNLAMIFTGANGWQVLGYLKNVFDTTAITGDFLNSDDTGLTTNVFLTDPRLYGVRVTKNF
jgi:iron complex outermembrane receptor protein